MKAFEDSKCRQSIVADTLQSLTQRARLWHDRIDLIEAGQAINRAELLADFGNLLDLCQNLRDAIASEDSAASWSNKDELHALVDRLDGVAATRTRYLELAHLLSSGTVLHRRERTRQDRLAQRDAAVAELMETSELASPPELPGPAVEVWLNWACSLEDGSNDPGLIQIQKHFPRVDDFVRQLEIEMWQDGPGTTPGEPSASTSEPAVDASPILSVDGETGHSPISIGEADVVAEVAPAESPAERISVSSEPDYFSARAETTSAAEIQAEAPQPVLEASSFSWEVTPVPAADPAPAAPEVSLAAEESSVSVAIATEMPEVLSQPARSAQSGKISFFPEEEVECFSLYLEKSKREPKDARKVRALFAISHWLNPIDQNPVSHPNCGIRAQISYTGATDLVPSSPSEASKAISSHNRLLLFTGGADLLRWSLSQPSNGHFDALASVRRLSLEHVRAWFHEIYKIELADPQLQDIYRLTSGIPLLVGEMHRLIVPDADAPPAWLGFELWTTILTNFGNRLPAIAHELGSGGSSVRLTEREIEILKMVVIASDEFSTPDTLVSSLMEDWNQYHHPDLRPLTSSDAESVALLQRLGLLPTRAGAGSAPIQALSPLEPGDALRQIVRYL